MPDIGPGATPGTNGTARIPVYGEEEEQLMRRLLKAWRTKRAREMNAVEMRGMRS